MVKVDYNLKMLKEFLVFHLKRKRKLQSAIFQQDDTLQHYALKIREFFMLILKTLELFVLVLFFSFSPLDLFLWRYVKDKVYRSILSNITEIKQAKQKCFKNFPVEMCKNTMYEFLDRLQQCFPKWVSRHFGVSKTTRKCVAKSNIKKNKNPDI